MKIRGLQDIPTFQAIATRAAPLTQLKPDTVSRLSRDNDGWHVSVDMIELKRIPEATDVLATYEVVLDEEGYLLSYQRIRRYFRDTVTEEG